MTKEKRKDASGLQRTPWETCWRRPFILRYEGALEKICAAVAERVRTTAGRNAVPGHARIDARGVKPPHPQENAGLTKEKRKDASGLQRTPWETCWRRPFILRYEGALEKICAAVAERVRTTAGRNAGPGRAHIDSRGAKNASSAEEREIDGGSERTQAACSGRRGKPAGGGRLYCDMRGHWKKICAAVAERVRTTAGRNAGPGTRASTREA